MSQQTALHRFAWSVVVVATGTLIVGALVTSKNAGMAFRDWPTSDGQFILAYPWLADFAAHGDKFLEHGHRLAGVLIGLLAIALVVLVARYESRRSLNWLARCVLLGVIAQGLLGGLRVQLDARGLALLHGAFAAVVLSLMGSAATMLSPRWLRQSSLADQSLQPSARYERLELARIVSLGLPALLSVQFLVGGLIRHQGRALYEHLGLGIVSGFAMALNALVAYRTRDRWVRQSALAVLGMGLLQISLGAGAWITKFGLATTGYVAVADSIMQVATRSAHTVVGVLLVMASVVHALRTARACHFGGLAFDPVDSFSSSAAGVAGLGGRV